MPGFFHSFKGIAGMAYFFFTLLRSLSHLVWESNISQHLTTFNEILAHAVRNLRLSYTFIFSQLYVHLTLRLLFFFSVRMKLIAVYAKSKGACSTLGYFCLTGICRPSLSWGSMGKIKLPKSKMSALVITWILT